MTTPKVVVFDYGSGNVRSAVRALEHAGAAVELTSDFDQAMECDGLVVPGVGAFAACMQGINQHRGGMLVSRRLAGGRPVLGICVGFQVMFERGIEHGIDTEGLGEWPGVVEELKAPVLPHMGWNTIEAPSGSNLFAGVESERFYFVHSYAVTKWSFANSNERLNPPKVTWSEHGQRFISAIENGPLTATQFHPEKSGDAGLHLLNNWIKGLK